MNGEGRAARWRPYVIPALLSAAVAFSGWSVAQHVLIRGHDIAQEQRLTQLEYRVGQLEAGAPADRELHDRVVAVDTKANLMLEELKRVRDRLERLEARR